MLNVKTCCWH